MLHRKEWLHYIRWRIKKLFDRRSSKYVGR